MFCEILEVANLQGMFCETLEVANLQGMFCETLEVTNLQGMFCETLEVINLQGMFIGWSSPKFMFFFYNQNSTTEKISPKGTNGVFPQICILVINCLGKTLLENAFCYYCFLT